eukprot:3589372-Rhodomonas_salina.1
MMRNASSGAMLDRWRRLLLGYDGLGVNAITVGGIYVISNASSGLMLDRGRWLSQSGAFLSRFCSSATSCKFLHLPANPFYFLCYIAV